MTAMNDRFTRLVWFNSILEAATLSDDHIDYIQQLINLAVAPQPSASPTQPPPLPFLTANSVIPELLVSLVKGDFLDIYLHPRLFPLLTLLNATYNTLVTAVKHDPSIALRSNLINCFAQTIYDWLSTPTEPPSTASPHTQHDENQCLVVILGIASMQLFTQVNYAGLPLVLPVSRDNYKSNTTSLPTTASTTPEPPRLHQVQSESTDSDLTTPTLQQSINLFFNLFSQRSISDLNDSKDVLIMTSPQYQKNSNKNRQLHTQKLIVSNTSLKLNGEDTYQCAYFPLFLIIARAIFGCEEVFNDIFQPILPNHTISSKTTNKSVFSLIVRNHFIPFARRLQADADPNANNQNSTIPQHFMYFSSPALLHYIIRSIKLHMEILLTPIASIRTEYYTISLLYQVLYGVLCSNTTFQDCKIICSEFKCIPFQSFHKLISPFHSNGPDSTSATPSPTSSTVFHTIASAFTRLIAFLPSIKFIDILSGEDFTAGSLGQKAKTEMNVGQYNSLLLTVYNALAQHVSTTPQSSHESGTNGQLKLNSPDQLSTSQSEVNVDDMHAVGISPLTHKHVHTTYTQITLLSPTPSTKPSSIPLTLSTSLLSSITIELAHIALKLYAYKRSFLLLSLAKMFSGVCIFVSGVLGRRTRYQARSFAQLHGTSFVHKDVMNQITKDAIGMGSHAVPTTARIPTSALPIKYQICPDITDTLLAPYIINTNDPEALRPKVKKDERTAKERETYKGVLNLRNPTIPRISTLFRSSTSQPHTDDAQNGQDDGAKCVSDPKSIPACRRTQEDGVKYIPNNAIPVCITQGGHVEDVPIDSVDDLYLTYMLPDQDSYNVDEDLRKKELQDMVTIPANEERSEDDDDDDDAPTIVVKAGDNLEGIAALLYQAGGNGGLVFEPNTQDVDSDVANQANLQQIEPPLDTFLPYYQTSIGSLLNLNVANYLYETCPPNEITQEEQDCYLQSIFAHKHNQGTCYIDQSKNKHGKVYDNYENVFEYNMLTTPYAVNLRALMLRSALEYSNTRLQIRSISQIELLSNIYVGHEEKLRQIHFQPTLLPDVIQLYHNTGIDHTKYEVGIKQVTKTESMLTFLYDNIDQPHHRYKLDHPVEYDAILTKTIRNITRFRMNKIYTAGTAPWWEVLRTCADICTKTGFVSTALRCLVNVQLWSNVVDTLITIGRRGDATKLLKRVLRIPKDMKPNSLLEEAKKVHVTEANKAALGGFTAFHAANPVRSEEVIDNADWALMFKDNNDDYGVDLDDIDEGASSPLKPGNASPERPHSDTPTDTNSSNSLIKAISTELDTNIQQAPNSTEIATNSDDEDPDYQDGSLLSFVARSMEATVHTTTTTSGVSTLSASSYRLYHLLGESTQEATYWDIAWELSHHTYAPPQRSIAKWFAVRKFDEKAYECYKNALDLNGSDHQTWYECGVVATRLQWYDKAISAFSNALRIKPDISEGWNNLAACHLYLQNTSSAYHALSQCLRTRRTSWKIWENYLQCALQLGHYNDVLTSLMHISELKGKIDPMTLMPIQYTTDQSKMHVFALYATWFEFLQPQTKNELKRFKSIQPECQPHHVTATVGPKMQFDENDDHKCSLCVQHPTENVLPGAELNAAVLFPIVQSFQRAIQLVLTNIAHNESREREMGGKVLGGGDDSGAANSFSAQLDQLRAKQAYEQEKAQQTHPQDDDDNAQDIINGDGTNTTLHAATKRTYDEITAENFMQALSESSKGQKCILQHLLGLSHKLVAISGDIVSLQQSSSEFEGCIQTLVKMCQDDSYNKHHMYHMEFILINFKLIFANARICDDHTLHHFVYGVTDPATIDAVKAKVERSDANAKDMLALLCNRIIDGWKRDHTNNKLNLAHLLPYIDQLQSISDQVAREVKVDDDYWKANFSTTSAEAVPANDFGGYEYDPYGSYY